MEEQTRAPRTRKGDDSKRIKVSGSDNDAEDDGDHLSRLPEHVLLQILAYLPTKDLVRTILVPQLRTLWPFVQSLSFDYDMDGFDYDYMDPSESLIWDEKFWNLIRNVLRLHQSPTIQRFRFHIPFHLLPHNIENDEILGYLPKNEIDACVRFAVEKKVQVLDFNLHSPSQCQQDRHYRLSSDLFGLRSLRVLILGCCDINSTGNISLVSLQTLCLRRVGLTDGIMDGILAGSPSLSTLSLTDCMGLKKLKIMSPVMNTLLILDQRCLQVFCPYVASLTLGISKGKGVVDLMNISSLQQAVVHFDSCFKTRAECNAAMLLLEKLHHTNAVEVFNFTTKVFDSRDFTKLEPSFFNWRSLELGLFKMHLRGLSKLLSHSSYLEKLILDIHYCNSMRPRNLMRLLNMFNRNYRRSNVSSVRCLEFHMKTITILCRTAEPFVFQLVEFLLTNAALLEKMVISISMLHYAKNSNSEDTLSEISKQISSYHRASTKAVIHVTVASM